MKYKGVEYVSPSYKGKNKEKIVVDAAEKGDIQAYVQHPGTKQMHAVPKEIITRMKNGENFNISTLETWPIKEESSK